LSDKIVLRLIGRECNDTYRLPIQAHHSVKCGVVTKKSGLRKQP